MSRPVGIAELKANLSAVLRKVKRGESVTVMDRDTAVARLIPVESDRGPLRIHRAHAALSGLRLPSPLRTRSDIVQLLIEERGER